MLRKLYEFLTDPGKEDEPKQPSVKNENLLLRGSAAGSRGAEKDVQIDTTENTWEKVPSFNVGFRPRPIQNGDLHTLTIGGKGYDLWFRKHWNMRSQIFEDLQERVYQIGERKYKGRETFTEKEDEVISNNERIWEDAYQSKVLAVYDSIPTFDSSDREWDSMKADYLIFDGEHIDAVRCHYGYKMGSIEVYERLFAADQEFRAWLERLDFPIEDIKWLDYSLWQ